MIRGALEWIAELYGHRHEQETRRIWLFALVVAPAVLAATAWAQQSTRLPVVAVLMTHASVNDVWLNDLRAGLRVHGYEDGRNLRLEPVTANGQLDRLPSIASELVLQGVDIIICPNELSIRTAQKATSTIPIVMLGFGEDPVGLGLIESLRRPGGNTTGLYSLLSESEPKRLEILREVVPSASRIAVFWDRYSRRTLEELQRAAQSQGVRLEPVDVARPEDLDGAFKTAKARKAAAVILLWSPITYIYRERIATLAADARLPTIWPFAPAVKAGALISYGVDLGELYGRIGYYVDRLLRGAKAGELPVEQGSTFHLAVNLKTAKALGISIPESVLVRADEVIR